MVNAVAPSSVIPWNFDVAPYFDPGFAYLFSAVRAGAGAHKNAPRFLAVEHFY
jgi:hypothetical protein